MIVRFTFEVLLVLTAALVLIRIFWPRIPHAVRTFLVAFAVVFPACFCLAYAGKWSTPWFRVNYGLYWLLIACYEFWLILFTRLRPRWLTTLVAVVFILPVLSASIFLPLVAFFQPPRTATVRIGDNFVSETEAWLAGTVDTSGVDLTVYYQPRWLPLLRRTLVTARYYGGQCDANAAYAVIQQDQKHVEMVCPAAPYLPVDSARSIILPLHRPLFHKHIKEVIPSSR